MAHYHWGLLFTTWFLLMQHFIFPNYPKPQPLSLPIHLFFFLHGHVVPNGLLISGNHKSSTPPMPSLSPNHDHLTRCRCRTHDQPTATPTSHLFPVSHPRSAHSDAPPAACAAPTTSSPGRPTLRPQTSDHPHPQSVFCAGL